MNRALRMTTACAVLVCALLTATLLPGQADAQAENKCSQDLMVHPGDSLSAIAARTLGSSARFPAIVAATNARAAEDPSYTRITNPAVIAVGWKLCIPGTTEDAPSAPDQADLLDDEVAARDGAPAVPASPQATSDAEESGQDDVPYVVDLAPGELHPLTIERMRQEAYPGSALAVEQTLAPGSNYDRFIVSYQSEGNRNFALLTIPQGEAPESGWPVIIFNHGYIPPEQYRTTERYVAYVDGFARNGYMVLRPDYRGHGFSEGEATGGYSTPNYTVDVLNAVASIKRHPQADAQRIGMWGHSMGGQITLRAMVVSDDIKAGVIWAGVVAAYPEIAFNWRRDGQYPIPSTIPHRAVRWRTDFVDAFGSPEENPEFWASISPNSYVADLSGPIQLHHGTADASVPFDFSTQLAAEIEAVGGAVESHIYQGDDHNLSGQFGTAMARSIAFFDTHVK